MAGLKKILLVDDEEDLREAARFPGLILWSGELRGPRAVPGTYQVRLTVDGKTLTQPFEILRDPRIQTTPEEFARQFTLLSKIRDKLTETHNAITQIREVRRQVDDLLKRIAEQPATKPVADGGRALNAKLTANANKAHGALIVTEDVRVSSSNCGSLPCTGV